MVIQRIQNLYLLLAFVALVIAMFSAVGTFIDFNSNFSYEFTPLYVMINGVKDFSVAGMFIILLVAAITSFLSICSFKKLILQIRLSIFNIIVMIGYYITFFVMWYLVSTDLDASYKMHWSLCLPIVSIILTIMAIRGMARDQKLLSDANSMRLRD